ncbi:hypothetical protein BDR05DRAFT_949332 [Suillus weaverae]|nr:hypothetical protein BDR05DRAFT_949332 [Suillus weaverae]
MEDSDQWVNLVEPPGPPTQSHDTAPELPSDTAMSNNNTEPVPEAASFLDPTADDKLDPLNVPIGKVIEGLIKDATKHKSFSAQFKLHAVRNYLELLEHYQFQTLPPSRAGKHHTHPSLLNNKRVHQSVRCFLTVQEAGQHKVNGTIIPALGLDLGKNTISENCARHWLKKLGYELTSVKKGIYVDGHECADVVEYRKEFLAQVAENEHLWNEYDDKTLDVIEPTLLPGERKHVPIAEDTTLPVNECLKCYDSRKIIFPGKNADGWWTAEMLVQQVEQVILLFEWTYPDAVAEFFLINLLLTMNVKPGGKQRRMHSTTIPTDNLRGVAQDMCFAENLPSDHPFYEFRGQPKGMKVMLEERGLWDRLCAGNNGKALIGDCTSCKMTQKARDALARSAAAQSLFDDAGDENAAPEDNLHPNESTTCCMRKVLSLQADFLAEKPQLQLVIEAAGHKCYFLPKFYCELNPIEMYWGWVKIRLRALADGTFPTARRLVPEILGACPTKVIRAFYRKTWCYMDAYSSPPVSQRPRSCRKGLDAKQAEYAVKKYRSHRKVGAGIMAEMDVLNYAE